MKNKEENNNWWFSNDKLRGFCLDSVIGYDYKSPGKNIGYYNPVIYVYTSAGILHFSGNEADMILNLIKEKIKQL